MLRRGNSPEASTLTVFATLDLAMRRIDAPEAEDLLGLIACLAPDAIPRTLLEQAFDPDGAREGSPPRQLRLADALAALGRYSLIKAGPQLIEAHRLVQAVAWDRLAPEVQARHAARAVTLLEAAFPRQSHDVRTWDACKALQPHADHAARLAERCRTAPATVGALLDRVGIFDRVRARFRDAEARYRRALTIKEASYGPDHPEVASSLDNLGNVARDQGDLAEARLCLKRSLQIFESSYGPEHPQVAHTLTNLGLVARDQGELAEARRCQERALRIFETSYGPDHPQVARTLTYLGNVARDQGELAEARRCQERALRINEASYGPDHPEVARTLGNLGYVLVEVGEPARAKPLVERALGIFRKFLGDEHPHTLWRASLFRRSRRGAEANVGMESLKAGRQTRIPGAGRSRREKDPAARSRGSPDSRHHLLPGPSDRDQKR